MNSPFEVHQVVQAVISSRSHLCLANITQANSRLPAIDAGWPIGLSNAGPLDF